MNECGTRGWLGVIGFHAHRCICGELSCADGVGTTKMQARCLGGLRLLYLFVHFLPGGVAATRRRTRLGCVEWRNQAVIRIDK
jgi:hypothetical protein